MELGGPGSHRVFWLAYVLSSKLLSTLSMVDLCSVCPEYIPGEGEGGCISNIPCGSVPPPYGSQEPAQEDFPCSQRIVGALPNGESNPGTWRGCERDVWIRVTDQPLVWRRGSEVE